MKYGHLIWSQTAVLSANCPVKWGHLSTRDTFGLSQGCPYFTGFTVFTGLVLFRGLSTLHRFCCTKKKKENPMFILATSDILFSQLQSQSTHLKVRIPIAMQRDLRQRRCAICGSNILLLYFQWSRHSPISDVNFFIPENIATSFPPALSRRFAIWIALGQRDKYCSTPHRSAKLRWYWKRVFLFITSTILSLSSARKLLLEFQL
jgi:hypothetical protein